jgi:hypothetical protein
VEMEMEGDGADPGVIVGAADGVLRAPKAAGKRPLSARRGHTVKTKRRTEPIHCGEREGRLTAPGGPIMRHLRRGRTLEGDRARTEARCDADLGSAGSERR